MLTPVEGATLWFNITLGTDEDPSVSLAPSQNPDPEDPSNTRIIIRAEHTTQLSSALTYPCAGSVLVVQWTHWVRTSMLRIRPIATCSSASVSTSDKW